MPSISQLRIHGLADLLDRRQQRRQALERVVLALHRDEHAVRRDQRVHRQHVQRRRTIDENDVEGSRIGASALRSLISRPVSHRQQPHFRRRKILVRRQQREAAGSIGTSAAWQLALAEQHLAGAALELLLVDAAAHGRVALRIEVDQQHAALGRRQRRGEIDRGGRLADAALLVRDRDDALHATSVLHRAESAGESSAAACLEGLASVRGDARDLSDAVPQQRVRRRLRSSEASGDQSRSPRPIRSRAMAIGDDIGRPFLAAGALEYFREARRDARESPRSPALRSRCPDIRAPR